MHEEGASYINATDVVKNPTRLHTAVFDRQLDALKRLLHGDASQQTSTSVNAQTSRGITALHLSVSWLLEAVQLLCRHGADPTLQDEFGCTALHYVVGYNDDQVERIIDVLLKNGADVNARNARGKTPLHYACIKLQTAVIKSLLHHSADCNVVDEYGATPLHYTALFRPMREEFCRTLRGLPDSEQLLSRAHHGDLAYSQLVHLALHAGHVTGYRRRGPNEDQLDYIISGLLSVGSSEIANETRTSESGGNEQLQIVEILIDYGADVNAADRTGRTPLLIASCLGHTDVVCCLLQNGTELYAQDKHSKTALYEAVSGRHAETVSLLLAFHMSLDSIAERVNPPQDLSSDYVCREASGSHGKAALHKAAENDDTAIIKLLLSNDFPVNSRDALGLTPLHYAAIRCSWQAMQLLLESGADCNASDEFHCTSLHYLFMFNDDEDLESAGLPLQLVKFILDSGADANMRTKMCRRTPLHFLLMNYNKFGHFTELFDLLVERTDMNVQDNLGNTWAHEFYLNRLKTLTYLNGKGLPTARNRAGLTPQLDDFKAIYLKTNHEYLEYYYGMINEQLIDNATIQFPLQEVNFDYTITDNLRRNLLHLMCSRQGEETENILLIIQLLDRKVCVDIKSIDFLNRTCLHHFCICRKSYSSKEEKIYRTLLERFQEIMNRRDIFGRTPLFYAIQHYQSSDFVDLLITMSADRSIADNNGVLPGEFAVDKDFNDYEYGDSMLRYPPASKRIVIIDDIAASSGPVKQNDSRLSKIKTDPLKEWQNLNRSRNAEAFSVLLTRRVLEFVGNVMKKVASIDSRFTGEVKLVGSSNENVASKSMEDEFDCLIFLPEFEKRLQPDDNRSSSMATSFELLKDFDQYGEFVNSESKLLPFLVSDRLKALLIEVIAEPDVWTDGVFEYLSAKIEHKSSTSPAITMTLRSNCLMDDDMIYFIRRGVFEKDQNYLLIHNSAISIDFVPAIRTGRKLSPATAMAKYIEAKNIPNDEELAIMKPSKGSYLLCSTSFGTVETEIVRTSPENVRAAYALLKGTLFRYFTDQECRYPITKYALKCCLLHCIVTGAFDEIGNKDITSESIMLCIRILLRRLWKVVVDGVVPFASTPETYFPVWKWEPFPNFCKWYLQILHLPFGVIFDQFAEKCEGCFQDADLARDTTDSLELLPVNISDNMKSMRLAFNCLHHFCQEFSSLTPNECHQLQQLAIAPSSVILGQYLLLPSFTIDINDVDDDRSLAEVVTELLSTSKVYCTVHHTNHSMKIDLRLTGSSYPWGKYN